VATRAVTHSIQTDTLNYRCHELYPLQHIISGHSHHRTSSNIVTKGTHVFRVPTLPTSALRDGIISKDKVV